MDTARLPTPESPEVRPTTFSHLVLKTSQFEEMKAWYKTVLNAKPLFENQITCFLTYDEEHHRVMIGHAPTALPRDPERCGVVHWAYSFQDFEQLVNAYVRLREQGIVPKACINHGFTTSLYYPDPDGNEVELAVDNFSEREAMDAWFRTGAFDRNFVGVPFDPEDMVKYQREGTDVARLFRESYE